MPTVAWSSVGTITLFPQAWRNHLVRTHRVRHRSPWTLARDANPVLPPPLAQPPGWQGARCHSRSGGKRQARREPRTPDRGMARAEPNWNGTCGSYTIYNGGRVELDSPAAATSGDLELRYYTWRATSKSARSTRLNGIRNCPVATGRCRAESYRISLLWRIRPQTARARPAVGRAAV